MATVLLASQSPRRRLLLEATGMSIRVAPAAVDETPRPNEAPRDLVLRLAEAKARAADARPGEPVLAADTTVDLDGVSLGKPANDDEARGLLRKLSGRTHTVWTGFCVRVDDRTFRDVVGTQVRFRRLSDADIDAYIATGEPFDKAGGYGIQGQGGALVDEVFGSYPNVVGLPVAQALDALASLGWAR